MGGVGSRGLLATPMSWLDLANRAAPLLACALLLLTVASAWRTDFASTWILLVVAAVLLAPGASSVTFFCLASLLFAASMTLQRVARSRVLYRPERNVSEQTLNDETLLTDACAWTFDGLAVQHRAMMGDHRWRRLVERFNIYAETTDWMTTIVADRMESSLPSGIALPERGRRLGAALSLFLALIVQDIGEAACLRALSRSYDALLWEERELASAYLFGHVDQARSLGVQFRSARTANAALLRQMPIFGDMSDEETELLASRMTLKHVAPGEKLIRQGDKGNEMYVIRSGTVEVSVQEESGDVRVLGQLGRGRYVGEAALLNDARRNATCRALIPTEVLVLSRVDFAVLVKDRFQLGERIIHSIRVTGLLRSIPVFSELDGKMLQQIAASLQTTSYEAGSYLMRQGEIGDSLNIIASGRVEVIVTRDGADQVVNQLDAGAYVGEIALLMNIPRTASVRALVNTTALTMHGRDFAALVAHDLYAAKTLELETSRRLESQRRLAAPAPA